MASYTEELLPCTSFQEFCDVAGKCIYFKVLIFLQGADQKKKNMILE